MRIIIKAKPLQWKKDFLDGVRVWRATLFDGQVKYMITDRPYEPNRYGIHIGQDFKGDFSSFDEAKYALQADFEEHLSSFLKVVRQ